MNDQPPFDRPPFLNELRSELLRAARNEAPAVPARPLRTRMTVVLGGAAILVAGAIAGALLTVDRGQDRSEEGIVSANFAASGTIYETLPSLVENSQLVVTGTVDRVAPGAVIPDQGPGPPPGPSPIRHLNTIVKVDEALKGSAAGDIVVVKTLEDAFGGRDAADWRKPGTEVMLFLSPSNEQPGLHIPSWDSTSGPNYDQTVYIVDEDNGLSATSHDPLAESIAERGLPGLREAVQNAR